MSLHKTAVATFALMIFSVSGLLVPNVQADQDDPVADAAATPDKPKPLWEVGLAAGVGSFADYPASDRYRVRFLPVPYFIYRGSFLRADEEGPRLRAKFSPSVELQFSGGGSLASQSSSSGPRAGMPDLDYLLELGPSLKIIAAQPTKTSHLVIQLPVRAVFSTNFGSRFDWRGVVFAPQIGLEDHSLFGGKWGGQVRIGTEFAAARTQQYYYQVDPQYAQPDRPAYDAHGGYLGSNLQLAVFRPVTPNFHIYAGGRFNLYQGARNEDSPLFKSATGFSGFVGFAWSIWQSRKPAPSNGSSSAMDGGDHPR